MASDGTLTLTSFSVGDNINDTDTDVDTETDDTEGADTGQEVYTDTTTSPGSSQVQVTGTPTSWGVTLDENYTNTFNETDNGNGDDVTDNGESNDIYQFNESDSGSDLEIAHLQVTGDANSATVQNLNLTDTGGGSFTAGETDADTVDQANGDTDNETDTSTDGGPETFFVSVIGSDGAGYGVTDNETITDGYTDGDNGGDNWNDLYTDPASGSVGTENGLDLFSDNDTGSELDTSLIQGTLDTYGSFTLTNLNADENGTATEPAGSESGIDTIAVNGETDQDIYNDSSQNQTDAYDIHLTNSDQQINAAINQKISGGTENDSDTDLDTWPNSGSQQGPPSQASEVDQIAGQDSPTITESLNGPVDSSGNLTVVGSSIDINGTNQSSETDTINLVEPEAGQLEALKQVNTTIGPDKYDDDVDYSNGAMTSLDDTEDINQQVTNTISLQPASGTGPDVGSGSLSGPVHAYISQTGDIENGGFTLDPTSGNDSVNLIGNYNNTTDQIFPGGDFYAFAYLPLDLASISPTQTEVKTVLTDPNLTIKESDTESGATTTVGNVNFADNPQAVVTTTYTFGIINTPDTVATGAIGQATQVVTNQVNESVSGTPQSESGTINTLASTALDESVNWTYGLNYGYAEYHNLNSVSHAVVESPSNPANPQIQDTTTTDHNYNDAWTCEGPTTDPATGLTLTLTHSPPATNRSTDHLVTVENYSSGTPTLVSVSGGGNIGYFFTGVWTGPDGTEVSHSAYIGSFTYIKDGGAVVRNTNGGPEGVLTWWYTGVDPFTGEPVDSTPQSSNDPVIQPSQDWFAGLSNFSTAVADKVSGGLTKEFRQAVGYDDGVNYNSRAYQNGAIAGEGLAFAVNNLTPCRVIGWARTGLRVLHGAQAVGGAVDSAKSFSKGDIFGGMTALGGAFLNFSSMLRSCFVAGTPLLIPSGSKPIEEFVAGDLILSRDEDDPDAPVVARRVLQTFVRISPVLNLHVGGRIIGTSVEHPFYVVDKGWVEAGGLHIGDLLVSHDGQVLPVEGIADSGRIERVYNLEIEEDHTYFVGEDSWGWSVWSNNYNINSARKAAVRQAWREELALVKSTGVGTRRWTAAQIAELKANGKVKGFYGHHINSVSTAPLLAGVSDNIAFLTKAEHLLAHSGNWRIPTIGKLLKR